MPYFNLNPKQIVPWDLIAYMLFPNDRVMALLAAAYELIHHRTWEIIELERQAESSQKNADRIDEIWSNLHAELNIYGGVACLVALIDRVDFSKKYNQSLVEAMNAGRILRIALQIDMLGEKVSRKNAFIIAEEEIARIEKREGPIYSLGEKVNIKKSQKRLYDCWRNYSCVAHWWAAVEVLVPHYEDKSLNPHDMMNIPLLRALSDAFLERGSSIMIRDQNGHQQPFLLSEEAWQLKPVKLRKKPTKIKVDLPPLKDWAIDFIKKC